MNVQAPEHAVSMQPADTNSRQLDIVINTVRHGCEKFAALTLDERIALATAMQQGVLEAAPRMAAAGCRAKGIEPGTPLLLITHGFSGSGKTSVTGQLISRLPAIRCRSDLERKRLHGLAPDSHSGSKVGAGLYTESSSQATYATLLRHATSSLRAGINIMVDAAFLQCAERESFMRLAAKERAGFAILDCRAPEPMLRRRIEARLEQRIDVSEATVQVLNHQLAANEPFGPDEITSVVPVDTQREINYDALERRIRASLPPLRGQAFSPIDVMR